MTQLWPVHSPPKPEEALSTWLGRLAKQLGCTSRDLLVNVLGLKPQSEFQIDMEPQQELIASLVDKTGVSPDRIYSMNAHSLVPLVLDSLSASYELSGVYVGGLEVIRGPRSGLDLSWGRWKPWITSSRDKEPLVCPYCLHRGEPYLRLHWRLSFVLTCPEHKLWLQRFKLSKRNPIENGCDVNVEAAPDEVCYMDRVSLDALRSGFANHAGRKIHVGLWFRLLRRLLYELHAHRDFTRPYENKSCQQVWSFTGYRKPTATEGRNVYERAPLYRQRKLMVATATALMLIAERKLTTYGEHAELLKLPLSHDPQSTLALNANTERRKAEWRIRHYRRKLEALHLLCKAKVDEELRNKLRSNLLHGPLTTEKRYLIDAIMRRLHLNPYYWDGLPREENEHDIGWTWPYQTDADTFINQQLMPEHL